MFVCLDDKDDEQDLLAAWCGPPPRPFKLDYPYVVLLRYLVCFVLMIQAPPLRPGYGWHDWPAQMGRRAGPSRALRASVELSVVLSLEREGEKERAKEEERERGRHSNIGTNKWQGSLP